ncbi:hypothetical protein ACPOL_3685 [Acidisarcina polymorpha]|uniref:Uncharacterized protein n=1 Tax=Acidisarcina polymorpha TaxID=2211140 RepID=A0A2Z5G368_9BACT|nr:hypothetical protein ACPOL_3685 [Acidisarcina polymorpha]
MLTLTGVAPGRAQVQWKADDATLLQANDAIERKQWPEAERLVRTYLGNHATSAQAHYLLAFTLFREDRPKESLAEYTNAARLQNPSALDLRWVALDYVLLHAYTDAHTWMVKSLELNPNDGESWYSLGRIQYTENRFAEAITSFNKALVLMPQSVKAEDNLGLAYEGLNQPKEAMAAYRQAIAWQKDKPDHSEQPLLNLGVLLLDDNKPDEALPLLQEAESLSPKNSKIHAALGRLYRAKDDLARAQTEFEQAVALDPDSAGLHFQLGQVYRKEGLATLAATEFQKVSSLGGTHSSE